MKDDILLCQFIIKKDSYSYLLPSIGIRFWNMFNVKYNRRLQ